MGTTRIIASLATLLLVFLTVELFAQQPKIANWRPYDQSGVTMFEDPKTPDYEFDGVKVRLGGSFTQQFQMLEHSNKAVDLNTDGTIDNPLYPLASGFNLATANMNIDAQLAPGVRLSLVTYLSSRHHPEAWVKGGYIQFDELPFFNSPVIDNLMDYATIRVGHMEVNYGDAHFRRTDNGNAMYNPFVGNLIMDGFTTEIGAEVYLRSPGGFFAMGGITGGEINGKVEDISGKVSDTDDKSARSPSILGKLGYDKQINDKFRFRLSGSIYTTPSSQANTLYAGDRTGSRYYLVLAPPAVTATTNFTTGRYNPGFSDKVTAIMGNVFVKYAGLELFGTYETANGRAHSEADTRKANQYAAELLYRIGKNENFYLGGRYNVLNTELTGSLQEVSIDRYQIGAGWFVTPNVLAKLEYVNQNFNDFPDGNILSEGNFKGLMIEAVVGF